MKLSGEELHRGALTESTGGIPRWLVAPVGVLLIVVIVNVYLVVVAVRSDVGYIEKDTYVRAQQYQQTIEAHRRLADEGWRITTARADEHLAITVLSASGDPISNLTMKVTAQRGDDPTQDLIEVVAQETKDGMYVVPFGERSNGYWLMRYEFVDADKQTLRYSERVMLSRASER